MDDLQQAILQLINDTPPDQRAAAVQEFMAKTSTPKSARIASAAEVQAVADSRKEIDRLLKMKGADNSAEIMALARSVQRIENLG